jgi:lipopolysaccharide export system protein LptA
MFCELSFVLRTSVTPTRLRRTIRSFAVVFAAFWVYRLLVAPWIDPSFDFAEQTGATEADLARVREADVQRLQKYARIFPPGSWELDDPIMIESEGVELLMKDYENLPGGRVQLSQCTMLYLEAGEAGARESGRVVILRAPEGAILRFDSDLNLRRGKVGKLKGGELKGPVTIHGTPSRPGADDELFVATQNVQINERSIWSDHAVEFRYGPHHGDGRGLVIKLSPGDGGGGQRRGPNIGGFERIELLRDVKMTLAGSTGLFPGDEHSAAMGQPGDPATSRNSDSKAPIEVTSRGPFYFDLAKRVATFRDQVDVIRKLNEGVADQLACDELQIYFGDKPTQNVPSVAKPSTQTEIAAGSNQRGLSLQVDRLVALGSPAVVDAPSNGVHVRANRLDYETRRRRMVVEAAPNQPDASLKWLGSQFGGRSLVVERPNLKALPLVTAKGAGWFDFVDPNDTSMTLKAHWARELNMRPDAGSHRVSLVGNAKTEFAQMGELKARQIDLWLVQLDKPAQRTVVARANNGGAPAASQPARKPSGRDQLQNTVTPLRLLAIGDVRFDSPRLTGDTQHLDVHFDPAGTLRPTPPKLNATRAGALGQLPARQPAAARQPESAQSFDDASVPIASANNLSPSGPEQPPQHFELHGAAIQARLVSQGEQTDVDFIEINGQVRLVETKSKQPTQRPLEIRGDWLQVQNAAAPQKTTVVVTGKPALIAARDLEMRGGTINLDRSRNLLWINGTGSMVLPPPRKSRVATAPTSRSQFASFTSLSDAPVQINFAGGMRFDGQVAHYERQVIIHSQSQTVRPNHEGGLQTQRRELKTDLVKATLARPIDFAAEDIADDAQVDTIACLGPVLMTEQTGDNRGLVSVASLSTRDLSIWQTTGKIHALGPGTLESTRLDSADPFRSRTAPQSANKKTADEPVYMRVDYEGEITGNLHQQLIELHDDIRGVYGPVKRWGDELPLNPNPLRPGEMVFNADILQASQAADPNPSASSLEFRAVGNTRVDGQTFSATAHDLSYVQGKGQLTLKGAGPNPGEGHNDAVLYYQPRPGGPQNELKAGTITYWPETNHAEVDKARTFQVLDVGRPSAPSANRNVSR